jgi:hypothetical protein
VNTSTRLCGRSWEILQDNLPEDQAEDAQTLARECAQGEADAVDKVKKILYGRGLNMNQVLDDVEGPQGKRTRAGVRAARTGRRDAGPMSFSPTPA